jgi:hydroxymethylpyrimidine pyrophosphatase-like HAD family hydrolase/adenine/guanine phosphoribosyltransferase-like PRPP-binding protein
MTDLVRNGVKTGRTDELIVGDLLCGLRELVDMLIDRLVSGDVLDAFLLAAGAVQVMEDGLERDTLSLRRGAKYLSEQGQPQVVSRVLRGLANAVEHARSLRSAEISSARRRDAMRTVRDALARAVVTGRHHPASHRHVLVIARQVRAELPEHPPRAGDDVLRLPNCFRSFDQQPEDMVRLAQEYSRRLPDRSRPVLVLGVRTSGSYLAPLIAAALEGAGHRDVTSLTMRPRRSLWHEDARVLRARLRDGAAAAVVDDPPVTGSSVLAGVDLLTRHGAAAEAITLLLPVFGAPSPVLETCNRVELPFDQWEVHRRLAPEAVGSALSSLLDVPVVRVEPIPSIRRDGDRSHVRAIYRVQWADERIRTVVVTGTGLGYLGRHAIAVADALSAHVPKTYGFRDGLTFREWSPELTPVHVPSTCDVPAFVSYVEDRAAALPAVEDRSRLLGGRQPVWEVAGQILAGGYGRGGVLLRPLMLDLLVRRLCSVDRPSVVDGATGLENWLRGAGRLVKDNADLRGFANTDLYCYDPVFDLAGIDPGSHDTGFVHALRAAYRCSDERFLLYELVHLASRPSTDLGARRAASRAVQRYMAGRFPAGPVPDLEGTPGSPMLCALDIDGVLESDALGFSIITPVAALALRSLERHGYRPVPVTGRSLPEVQDRCTAFGLAGGVAEYGAVAYEHATGRVVELVTEHERLLLDELREVLRAVPGVSINDDYRYSVRALRTGERHSSALPAEIVDAALRVLGDDQDGVRVVTGMRQTDFVAAATDKGTGLEMLASMLCTPSGAPSEVELAVGDTESDLPMLALARHAYAPGNATAGVRASAVTVVRPAYAAGLAHAVGRLLGHPPGGCSVCGQNRHDPAARVLLTLLGAQEAGRRGVAPAALRGFAELVRETP